MTQEEMRKEVLKKIKHGQILRAHSKGEEKGEVVKTKVVAFYPDFVLCQGEYKTCFSYYELWVKLQHKLIKVNIPKYIKG